MSLTRLLVYYWAIGWLGFLLLLVAGCTPLDVGNPACLTACEVTVGAGVQ